MSCYRLIKKLKPQICCLTRKVNPFLPIPEIRKRNVNYFVTHNTEAEKNVPVYGHETRNLEKVLLVFKPKTQNPIFFDPF